MPTSQNDIPQLLTVDEVAEILRLHPDTIRLKVRMGELKKVEGLGGAIRFSPEYIRGLGRGEQGTTAEAKARGE